MSRMNPLHWIGGLALEIGAVAGVVMLLPKADLRPGRLAPEMNQLPLPASADQQPAWWKAAPHAAATSWQPAPQAELPLAGSWQHAELPQAGSFSVDQAQILTVDPRVPHAVVEQTAWQPAAERSPAGLPELPELSPAAVEQTLDRASQQLLNSVGGYLFQPAEAQAPTATAPASYAAPAAAPPQHWRRY